MSSDPFFHPIEKAATILAGPSGIAQTKQKTQNPGTDFFTWIVDFKLLVVSDAYFYVYCKKIDKPAW